MIVVDIETSGVDYNKCGIIQIGAIDIKNPGNTFLQDAKLGDEYTIVNSDNMLDSKSVTDLLGIGEEQMKNKNAQSEKELLEHFFQWVSEIEEKDLICQNPQFDYAFMKTKADKYGLSLPFSYRCMDLYTVAHLKYFDLKKDFLFKNGHSDFGLSKTLELCGMIDNRKEHNALEDAKLEAECFSRLVYGKGLLKEYAGIPVPEILKR
ncbi:MAG TPA: 3'-5' exonuclease [Patescibacteria group bacterium]|nr:3'-5' exonuclease [Patescibacteria group bacterium]